MAEEAILFDSYDMALKTFWLEVANKMTIIHRTLLLYKLKFLVLLKSTRSSSDMKRRHYIISCKLLYHYLSVYCNNINLQVKYII